MGISYNIKFVLGFEFSFQDIEAVFGLTTPAKYHMEDRFDPKTGAKLEPVQVIDEPGTTKLLFSGNEYPYVAEGLLEDLATALQCCGRQHGYDADQYVVFGPELPKPLYEGEDAYPVSWDGAYGVATIVALSKQLPALKTRLIVLGLSPDEPILGLRAWIG